MSKKNVLLIINQLHSGGAERVVANLSRDLSAAFNIHIAVFNDHDNIGYAYGGNLIKIKLPYSSTADHNSAPARAARLFSLVWKLRSIKKKLRIDVAVSFLEVSNFTNILSRRKEKVYISVRSYLTAEIRKEKQIGIYKKFIKALYSRADGIIVPSQAIGEDLNQHFGVPKAKVREIHNYISFERINGLKEEALDGAQYEALFNNPVLINVGRLHQAKGQAYLLPVFKKVKEVNPAAKLVIVGDGSLRESLIRISGQLDLKICTPERLAAIDATGVAEYDIFILGMQANPYKFLHRSRVFLFPSVYEGFPNALLEAMAIGLPVVAADCNSGPREILAPATDRKQKAKDAEWATFGVLMPPVLIEDAENTSVEELDNEHSAKWAAVINNLLTDSKQYIHYAEQAKARANDYSKEKITEKWSNLILTNPAH